MDVHVPSAVTLGLRMRGIDVLTAQEDGTTELSDDALLDRATALGRALVTQDEDLLREAAVRQVAGKQFAGVVYSHQLRVTLGQFIADLEVIVQCCDAEEIVDQSVFLPI
jgi:predicted nuclease of predicted toxin-antitoxin system